jgi:hypothetical protein
VVFLQGQLGVQRALPLFLWPPFGHQQMGLVVQLIAMPCVFGVNGCRFAKSHPKKREMRDKIQLFVL